MRCFLVFCLALLSTFSFAQVPINPKPNAIRFVAKESPALVERVKSIGTVLFASRESEFVLLPHTGTSLSSAKSKLRNLGLSGVAVFEPKGERLQIDPNVASRIKKGKLEFRRAREQMLFERAYPFVMPDPNQTQRAIQKRDRMMSWEPSQVSKRDINGNWQFMGPINLQTPQLQYFGSAPVSGRVNAAAFDPTNSDIMYLAAACGGIWKSVNAGASWLFLSQSWPDLHAASIAIDPTRPNIVYAGTGDLTQDQRAAFNLGLSGVLFGGMGVMKSIDGGLTWTPKGASTFGTNSITALWVDPTSPNTVVACAGAIYRSTDGGETWSQRTSVGPLYVNLSYSAPRSGLATGYLYTASPGDAARSSYTLRSSNGGLTWTILTRPSAAVQMNPVLVAASKVFPEIVYALFPQDRRVYKSTNAGTTWFATGSGIPNDDSNWDQSWYNYSMDSSSRVDNSKVFDVIYVGQKDIYASFNGGDSWRSIGDTSSLVSAKIHTDQHGVTASLRDPARVLVSNDGGIYQYNQSIDNFANLNRNLGIAQFYSADWSDVSATDAIGGTQDNGSPWLDNGVWRNAVGGDGGDGWIDPRNRAVMFSSSQNSVMKTDTSWFLSGVQGIPWMPNEARTFTPILEPDPTSLDRLYIAGQRLYRIDNVFLGATTALNGPNSPTMIRSIEIAKDDPNKIYCGAAGRVYMTINRGSSWLEIQTGQPSLPNRLVMDMSVNPFNANDLTVTLGGSGSAHVYRCSNVLAQQRSWRQVSGGTLAANTALPDILTGAIARDPRDPVNIWYVGTDIGVFVTLNAGDDWYNATASLQLPNVPITDMEAVTATKFLNVATFGRGMWRLPLTFDIQTVSYVTAVTSTQYQGVEFPVTVTLGRLASFPHQDVQIRYSGPVRGPASVRVAGGSRSVTFRVRPSEVTAQTPATITAEIGQSTKQLTVQVRPPRLSVLEFANRYVWAGEIIRARIALQGVPATDYVVQLSSTTPGVKFPSTLTFGKGVQSLAFDVETSPAEKDVTMILKAVSQDKGVLYATLGIRAAQVAAVETDKPEYLVGGGGNFTVHLTAPAFGNGTVVNLSAVPTGTSNLPTTIHVPAGARTASFQFKCIKPGTVTVTALTTRDAQKTKFVIK